MPKEKDTKLFAVKVRNKTRSCVILRQYDNGVWTFPIMEIPKDDDPLKHLDTLLEQIDGEFCLIHAINTVEFSQTDPDGEIFDSVIYDIHYSGRVTPALPEKFAEVYVSSQWVQIEALKNKKLNFATSAFVAALEKDPCLR